MKATKRITKNTIVNLINDVRCYKEGELSAIYNLSVYTDNQIEELHQRMENFTRNGHSIRWMHGGMLPAFKLEADIASERRDRKINKIIG